MRMIGGKGKGRGGSIVSLLVAHVREKRVQAEADAAVERWLVGRASESDRKLVVDALVACEARVRAGEVLLQRETDSPMGGAES